ncbi:hypothetical protein M422DRAFT_253676 [Sphaerobolus stellatus SS14]|uniref:Endonuclease/exonuclease/phosphatase domain-containing protein n=1 Tax=Sphaerobolus stellatus (strain SS14) TaxID=990650 RepID=A0A0C9UJB9_SPHS4|nr:hypothetical protein M422DRAFT_253676 [Sphaerobolus stellatus SS14]
MPFMTCKLGCINTPSPTAASSNIWLGDFNKHHQLWTTPETSDRCWHSNTDLLLHLLADCGMSLSLPPATPTYKSDTHRSWSTIDLVFTNMNLGNRIISCTASHLDHILYADHLPIHTSLNTDILLAECELRHNYRKVNWEKFDAFLHTTLQTILPDTPDIIPASPNVLDDFILKLMDSNRQAIQKHVAKRWWTLKLTLLWKEISKLSHLEFQARNTSFQQYFLDKRNTIIGKSGLKMPMKVISRPQDSDGQATAAFDTALSKAMALADLLFLPHPEVLPALLEINTPDPSPLCFHMPRLHQVLHHIEKAM